MDIQTIFNQALRYYDLGWSIIPVGRDKKPLQQWKQYQEKRATPQEIEGWTNGFSNMNIGVVTGPISGIVVIDVEKGGDISQFPKTAMAKTGGGGWHLYYRYPANLARSIMNSTRKLAPLTDVRATGGYCVLPPSIHSSGNSYEWIVAPEDGLTEIPPELLERLITNDSSQVSPDSTTTGDVAEGTRNDTATKYIGRVLHHLPLDLWQEAGWLALRGWNITHAKPPLDDIELRLIFESISQRERQSRELDAGKTINLKPFTLTELYNQVFPPGRWVVKDLIALGTITALTGDSNSYKTFLTQAMASSVVSGNPFLGHFPVTPGKVLVVDEENHRRHIQERFKSLGINATSDIIFLSSEGIKIDNEEHLKKLKEIIEKEKPTLVILDSLVRLHRGEENSAKEMSAAFSAMKQLVSDDRAILFIHHHRKPQGFARKNINHSIRGSSDIIAAVDSHLAIDRRGNDFVVAQTKMRLQPEVKPFKVSLVPNGDGTWLFVYQGADTSVEDRLQEDYDEVKTIITESSESLTIDMIADETQIPLPRIRQALKDLLKDKVIVITKIGAHGTHFYGLPPEEAVYRLI